jgi:hypothetical protein
VNPLLAVVALAVVAGAVAAVSLRDARGVVLGLAAVAVISPVLADPVPDPVGLAARLVAAILGAYLLWIAARPGGGSALAPAPATGAAGAIVGFAAHGLGATAGGPALASAAGFALATLAVTPLLTGRDILRLGVGLVLLLHAGLLVRVALGGTPAVLEQLVTAGLVAALGGALAVLVMAARSDGSGGLELATDQTPPRRREPDAHPLDGTGGDLAVEPR